MRSSSQIFVLFAVNCLADDNAGALLSNPVYPYINDQADSLSGDSLFAYQPIVSTNDPLMNTDDSKALSTSPKSLTNTNDQVESAATYNVALGPIVPEESAEVGGPTLQIADDHSSSPAASGNQVPSKNLAFDHRDSPLDCAKSQKVACCKLEVLMWVCEEFLHRLSDFCKTAELICCDEIDEESQCIVGGEVMQGNEDGDTGERVGIGTQGGIDMTDEERDNYLRDREAAQRRIREAAEQKAKKDELRQQMEFYQQEGDKIRDDAKNGANEIPDFQLPDWQLGLPEFVQQWLKQQAN